MALVLCTGVDDTLLATRRLILERAGHTVFTASAEQEIKAACKNRPFDVAVIGNNASPEQKQRMVDLIRQACRGIKVLELYGKHTTKSVPSANIGLPVPLEDPSELLERVNALACERAASVRSRRTQPRDCAEGATE